MKKGFCRLCGLLTDLSFEHIPPESAFNDQPITLITLRNHLEKRSYTKFRRGLGDYSLCKRCNNNTGGWYGAEYAKWARQGLEWLDYIGEKSTIQLPFHICPLNVLKQIIVMALAMTHENSIPYHQELREFVLNKERKYLPKKYNIYTYLTGTKTPRFESGMGIANTNTGANDYIDAEVAFPPFGYCMTSSSKRTRPSQAEENKLYEIGWFANFDYNLWTTVYLNMPKLPINTPFPLDYRTIQEVEDQALNQALNN